MPARSYATIARQYAEAVVEGDVSACRWVRMACQRQLNDLVKFKGKSSLLRFNPKLLDRSGKAFAPADNLCAFIERLPHVKGPLAGQTIHLEPWQVFILSTVFGWVKTDGKRRFRRAYIEVPRGNAKSTLSSALGAKGAGEAGTAGAPAAVLNAINDALLPFKARVTAQPITPEQILRALGTIGG